VTRLTRAQIVGAWELVRWEIVRDDGARTQPFGTDARGLLLYTPDGFMSASVMAARRAPFSTRTPRGAPAGERAAAFDSFFSYAGRFRVLAGEVRHDVLVALNPGQVGTLQTRQARLSGRKLELTADESLPGQGSRRHEIEWRRVRRRKS
jgi:hypothetical protein